MKTLTAPNGRTVEVPLAVTEFSADGEYLAYWTFSSDPKSGFTVIATATGEKTEITGIMCRGLTISADGSWLAVETWVPTDENPAESCTVIDVYHRATKKLVKRFPLVIDGIHPDMQISADGSVVAFSARQRLCVWNHVTGKVLWMQADYGTSGFALSPDGATLATAEGRSVMLWDAASLAWKRTYPAQTATVSRIEFSPDGTMLASASAEPLKKGPRFKISMVPNVNAMLDSSSNLPIFFPTIVPLSGAFQYKGDIVVRDLATHRRIVSDTNSGHGPSFALDSSSLTVGKKTYRLR